ncbi:MAG TPA: ornithine--oxo-acid transaminase, partial [Bacillota bacterium]|nr:ornithine--oxo-acid transaminase [Bacillota bacterium]
TDQLDRCTLTSRAFHNDMMGPFLAKLCQYTGYEMALPMNTGAEAVETALKLARRWGVEKKGIVDGQQEIIVAENNFHGRTITIVSFSTDPVARNNYGPYTPGFKIVPYDNVSAIKSAITPNTCAVLLEPIQGEAGVYLPAPGYLRDVFELCEANNVLFIADEIQTGFCRTGRKFACDHEGVKPHVMTLGKALGGGVIPVSAVVADKAVMEVFTPGSHGSTFGGYPLAMAVGIAALEILEDERLDENAERLGHIFRERVSAITCPKIVEVRGKGLLNAVVFEKGFEAWNVCVALKEAGLLAKQTHGNIIRFAPPLVITESQLLAGLDIIEAVFAQIK